MTAQDLLSQLREKGVVLKTSDGDRLVIDAPKGTITDELRDALKAHKSELLQILKSENAPKPPAIAAPKTEPQVADKPAITVSSVSQTEKQVATPTEPTKVAAPAPQTEAEIAESSRNVGARRKRTLPDAAPSRRNSGSKLRFASALSKSIGVRLPNRKSRAPKKK